jgi:Uma2 family endonuclease
MAKRLHHYTYGDYVAVERDSPTKHEFLDGEIYAMSGGGTAEHAALSAQTLYLLMDAVRDESCRVYTSDLRIYVEAVGLATFPDGSVVSGPLEQHQASPESTCLNPTVLLEVTSDSSEEYDNNTKLDCYRTIPTLRDYIIVSHRERRITVHSRTNDHEWTTRAAVAGGHVALGSIGADLTVDKNYRGSSIA